METEKKKAATDADTRSIILFGMVCCLVIGAGAMGQWLDNSLFSRYLGGLRAWPVFAGAGLLGFALLWLLGRHTEFRIAPRHGRLLNPRWLGAAAGLALPAAFVDWLEPFPRDMNVPLPLAWLFYPAIGFLVEVLFHVVPLFMLLMLARLVPPGPARSRLVWSALIMTALIEPVFQMATGSPTGAGWKHWWVGLHVFIINLAQVVLFKRMGFLSMYAFRLVYYLFWHIVWGHLRLSILF